MVNHIYLIAHAVHWDAESIKLFGPDTQPPFSIPHDYPLTEYGENQAKDLADHLAKLDLPKPFVIYTAPEYRCLQTLEPALDYLIAHGAFKVRVDDALANYAPEGRGKHPNLATVGLLATHFQHLNTNYESTMGAPPDGETIERCHERAKSILGHIVKEAATLRAKPEALMICAPPSTVLTLCRALKYRFVRHPAVEDFTVPSCSVFTFRRSPGRIDTWECLSEGDTSFLTRGAVKEWSFLQERNRFLAETDIIWTNVQNLSIWRRLMHGAAKNPYGCPPVHYLIPVTISTWAVATAFALFFRDFDYDSASRVMMSLIQMFIFFCPAIVLGGGGGGMEMGLDDRLRETHLQRSGRNHAKHHN